MASDDYKENIVLIGMPACGKSTVGLLLAKATCRAFVDTDLLIQNSQNKPLQSIIDQQGLEFFLECETKTILSLNLKAVPHVIATGGSVVLSHQAMLSLKSTGTVVFLDVALPSLISRLKNIHTRGIAMHHNQSIDDVYSHRLPLYRKYADLTIDATRTDPETLVERIIGELESRKC